MNKKGEFIVGDKEKHTISFTADFWWGRFSVYVDGNKTQIDNVNYITGPFAIEVGDKEKHTVSFQIIMKTFLGPFRNKIVQVLVDGKLYKTF